MLTVSLFIALIFLVAFFWATKNGQFDDGYSPSVRILFDDELKEEEKTKKDKKLKKTEDGNRKV